MKKLFVMAALALAVSAGAWAQAAGYDEPVDQDVPCDLANKHGHVEGMGRYYHGATAYLVAVPDDGYYFAGWSDGSTENPRVFVVEYSLESRFERVPEKIVGEVMTGEGLEFYTEGLTLRVEGDVRSDFQVFTAAGVLVYQGRENRVSLPMAGIYFLRSGGESYKLVAK